jgi:endonuclease/exonuclease/phosphatase family metal-dependent hydrolase
MYYYVFVRVATFNCENLFARFKFNKGVNPDKAIKDGWKVDSTKFTIYNDAEKEITAKTILATKADVIALQEVENLDTLRKFRSDYLGGRKKYPHCLVIDGNDPRRIDVGLLSKYPIENISTHINDYDASADSYDFSRDCLECDIVVSKSKKLRLFINHLKSMLDRKDPCKGRLLTRNKRLCQAKKIKSIVSSKMNLDKDDFVILGDLNDYLEDDAQGKSAIRGLVLWSEVENVVGRLPPDRQWTHYFKGNKKCGTSESYKQLDYILVSKSLAEKNPDTKPDILRMGLTTNAKRYTGPRLPGVDAKHSASDHCPVSISLNL